MACLSPPTSILPPIGSLTCQGQLGRQKVRSAPRTALGSGLCCFTLRPVLHTPSWGEGQQLRRLKNFIEHIQPESHLISTLSQ